METEPDTDNVLYMDEYPEIAKRVWLRRLAKERMGGQAVGMTTIIKLERPDDPPDGAA